MQFGKELPNTHSYSFQQTRQGGRAQSLWFVPCSFSIPGRLCLATQPSPLPAEGWNYLFKWKFEINLEPPDWRQEESCPGSNTDKSVHQHSRADSSASAVCRPQARSTRRRVANWQQLKGFLRDGVSVENWGMIAKHAPEILSVSHLNPEHRGTLTFLVISDRLATLARLPLLFKTRVHKRLLPASSYGRP